MFRKLKSLLFGNNFLYWEGRLDGWMACENMICERIKEHYPDTYEEMWEKLVQ